LNVSETFTHIQDKRKEVVLRSNYIFFRGLEAVEKKLKIERKLIFYLLPEEFVQKEQFANIDWQEIRDRRDKGVLVVNCDGRCHPIPRKQYEKELPLKNFYKAFDEVKEVKGSVAYKGLVRGVAKVLYNVKEIQEFKTGEILIANQTTPEYVPAMKKAAAFVTDQGGITCHAAIVAREMKKPCVIGAKAATKIFKSGDMVEVDANKGIVRKI
jgi:phosphohistidine swiveling domain-containing protein